MKSVSVPIELLERITRPQLKPRDETVRRRAITELRAILDNQVECRCKRYGKDNPHWLCPVHTESAAQHQGEPVAICRLWNEGGSGERTSVEFIKEPCADGTLPYAEQPEPAADHTQCEECKGWGYHENHYEGGGTECGECGGSGNATVAVVMPDRMKVEPFTTIDRGSKNYKAGYNAAIAEVARLNGVKT